MFTVYKRQPEKSEVGFEVLSVRVEDEKTLFLMFVDGDWIWEYSELYRR